MLVSCNNTTEEEDVKSDQRSFQFLQITLELFMFIFGVGFMLAVALLEEHSH